MIQTIKIKFNKVTYTLDYERHGRIFDYSITRNKKTYLLSTTPFCYRHGIKMKMFKDLKDFIEHDIVHEIDKIKI